MTLVPWQEGEHRSSARSICTTGSGQMGSVNQSPTIKHLMLVLLLRSTFNPMLSSRTTPDKCKTASSVTFAHRGCSIDFVLGNSGTINLPSNFLRVTRAGPCSDCSGAVGHRGAFSSISAEVNGKVGVVGLVGGWVYKGVGGGDSPRLGFIVRGGPPLPVGTSYKIAF